MRNLEDADSRVDRALASELRWAAPSRKYGPPNSEVSYTSLSNDQKKKN